MDTASRKRREQLSAIELRRLRLLLNVLDVEASTMQNATPPREAHLRLIK